MPKKPLSTAEIQKIISLRMQGNTLSELKKITGRSNGTIFKYIQGVKISPEFADAWKIKRGGSKHRAHIGWQEASKNAEKMILPIGSREKLIILACLYWGEGNKKELNLINSDPTMIKIFVDCLSLIGVEKSELKINIRMYEDMDKDYLIRFWSDLLDVSPDSIGKINILSGKKSGKLRYGMCRIRVRKGGPYFKIIMSMIHLIRLELQAAVV